MKDGDASTATPARLHQGATPFYLRYDGEIASGTDNHALNVGVRFSW